jgi:hypothetical protein
MGRQKSFSKAVYVRLDGVMRKIPNLKVLVYGDTVDTIQSVFIVDYEKFSFEDRAEKEEYAIDYAKYRKLPKKERYYD